MVSMNKEQIMESVSLQMPQRRWIHTQGVMSTARELAIKYGGDPDRAELAAIIHDVAKYWAVEDQAEYIRVHELDQKVLSYNKELWHAEVGAYYAKEQYGVDDVEVCDAIRYHTSGRANMTLLDKIIWLADYIEPNRNFPGVDKARALAEQSLEQAILFGLDGTIKFLIEKHAIIYPVTLEARNDMVQQVHQK